jgi:type IV secretion system protein TrbC
LQRQQPRRSPIKIPKIVLANWIIAAIIEVNKVNNRVNGEDAENRLERSDFMFRNRATISLPALAGWLAVMAWGGVARAAANGANGQPLPWEGPLNQVLASFTGPVAKALCILAIVILGFGFAFSDGGGLRRVLGLLLGVSIAVTATSFGVTFFGFDGGAGW